MLATITNDASSSTIPTISGRSKRWTAVMESLPTPLKLKTRSVMMAPPNTLGICSATSVTTGISALRTTCLTMTLRSPIPLERAVVT